MFYPYDRRGSSEWLSNVRYCSQARIRLFCFPYAGSSSIIYRNWVSYFPESVEVCLIQLPARGVRIHESPIQEFSVLIEAITKALVPFLQQPFAFFGHSLGSLVAFEVLHRLRTEYSLHPIHLFVSACTAPAYIRNQKVLSQLSNHELIAELRQLQGTPDELLDHEEIMSVLLPIVRSDFALYESYESYYSDRQNRKLLECQVTVLGGTEDSTVDMMKLPAWQEETYEPITLSLIPGNHFFLHSAKALVLECLAEKLQSFN